MIEVISCDLKTLENHLRTLIKQIPSVTGCRVFIKPNLGGRYPIIKSENTDAVFLKVLCKVLSEHNPTEIIIAHSSLIGFGYSKHCQFDDLIKINHYDTLSRDKNVHLLNLDDVPRSKEENNGFTFHIPEILKKEKLFYINLCKMKTHMETDVSLSLKNQMGLVSLEDRKNMHKSNLQGQIAALATKLRPDLNIIDGIIAMEGNGPHHGKNIKTNLVIAGTDGVEADSLACFLMGIDYQQVSHIMEAERLGVGKFVSAKTIKEHQAKAKKFKPSGKIYKIGTKFRVWPTTSCSGCIFSLNQAFKKFAKRHPIKVLKKIFFDETNIYIGECSGENPRNRKNIYTIGNCSCELAKRNTVRRHLKGCPPTVDEIIKLLEE